MKPTTWYLHRGLGALLLALFVVASQATSQTTVGDSTLRRDVEDAFHRDYRLHDSDLLVRASNGVITLRGELPSLLDSHAAETIARRTNGVSAVMNFIVVAPLPSDDRKILEDIEQRIAQSKWLDLPDFKVGVTNGVVTLYGDVASIGSTRKAERIAREVRGVRSIKNELRIVHPPTVVQDDQILADIESAYACDAYLAAFKIDISVHAGEVTLNGKVPNLFLKERALNETESVTGVRSVNNNLVTDIQLMLDLVSTSITDSELEKLIKRELDADPRIKADSIHPHVMRGEVILRGSVDSLYTKLLTERIARQLLGVRWVENELEILVDSRSEQSIRAGVEALFESDASLAAEKINVQVNEGTVTLTGQISAHPIRARAANLASRVPGVRSIANELQVVVAQPRSDLSIQQDIVRGLATNAITRGHIDDVRISVQDAVVTLSGEVDRYVTLLEVFRIANLTDRVRLVENQLKVKEQL